MSFALLSRVYGLVSGSSIIWKVISNWKILSTSLSSIETVMSNMGAEKRHLPTTEETQILLLACSNILKTKVIDIPGLDEYELAMNLDKASSSLALSIKDSTSGAYHVLPLIKKVKVIAVSPTGTITQEVEEKKND